MTLLELVAVLLVMALILAAAAPSLRGFAQGRQTADTARSLTALAAWARTQAVSEGRMYRLNIDAERGRYYVTAEQGGAFVRIDTSLGRTFELPEGMSLTWEEPENVEHNRHLTFYPTGRVTPASVLLDDGSGLVTRIRAGTPTDRFIVVAANEPARQGRRP